MVDAADDVLTGDKLQSYRDTISNPMDNEFWENINFTDEQLAELDIPMFFTDGWYDMTIGPIDFFSRLEKIHGPGQGPDRYLLLALGITIKPIRPASQVILMVIENYLITAQSI